MKFPVEECLNWYRINKRDLPWRRTSDIYSIWISEVMLQQTQVVTVIPYYLRFLERFPTIESLAHSDEQHVLKLWEGLGYYSRIRNFRKAAVEVMEKYGGRIPQTPEVFKTLPGVGPYITAAVLSIAKNVPIPTVDGNVMRVVARFEGIGDDIRKDSVRKRITEYLQEVIPLDSPGDFNQAMMELGAMVCTPKKPNCPFCPLNQSCTAYTTGTVSKYPYKSPAAKSPEYNVSIGIIFSGDRFYIQRRKAEGHLGGLWEFPGGKTQENESPEDTLIRECKEEIGADVVIDSRLTVVKHTYSHFKIIMSVFICHLKNESDVKVASKFKTEGEERTADREGVTPPEDTVFRWITVDELENYPFPGANHKFFPLLRRLAKGTVK